MSYGTPLVWRSDASQLNAEWRRVQAATHRMRLDRSPFVPRSLAEFATHRVDVYQDLVDRVRDRCEAEIASAKIARIQRREVTLPFSGPSDFMYGRAHWLTSKTIWTPLAESNVSRLTADWPTPDEYKEEGDERHTSGYGRFLPLIRDPGNPTVVWKQKNLLQQFPTDMVHPVPRLTSIELPNDYEEMTEPEYDVDGNPVDDPDASGNTCSVENLPSQTMALVQARSRQISSPLPPASSRPTTSRRRTVSNLNPGVPEFRPLGATGVTSINSFSALDSHETSLESTPHMSPQKIEALKNDFDHLLPDFIVQDTATSKSQASRRELPTTADEEHKLAIEKVFQEWYLPSIDEVETVIARSQLPETPEGSEKAESIAAGTDDDQSPVSQGTDEDLSARNLPRLDADMAPDNRAQMPLLSSLVPFNTSALDPSSDIARIWAAHLAMSPPTQEVDNFTRGYFATHSYQNSPAHGSFASLVNSPYTGSPGGGIPLDPNRLVPSTFESQQESPAVSGRRYAYAHAAPTADATGYWSSIDSERQVTHQSSLEPQFAPIGTPHHIGSNGYSSTSSGARRQLAEQNRPRAGDWQQYLPSNGNHDLMTRQGVRNFPAHYPLIEEDEDEDDAPECRHANRNHGNRHETPPPSYPDVEGVTNGFATMSHCNQ